MKGKLFFKALAIASLTAFVTPLVSANTKVKAEDSLTPLYKYQTNTPIFLHGEHVKVPKVPPHNKREFRSMWVSTVSNIDFPSKPGLTVSEFKKEYLDILNTFESLNMNAVTFQVRPMNDAFYSSELNPWSEFLSGKQGEPIMEKGKIFDPLAWAIEETHKRNMEFHAWFNPYRVAHAFDYRKSTEQVLAEELPKLHDSNFAKKHPEYLLRFDNKLIMDPGIPEVQKFVRDSIMEVVTKYDVDAIHFDDYFYPYKTTRDGKPVVFGDKGEDAATFEKYGGEFKGDIKAWRRNNIDSLIHDLSKEIKAKKPYVKFGISPFGIWGHEAIHPGIGSHTPITSSASYDDIYADTRKWVKSNWIDYITPQIYWAFGTTAAPYAELADWWSEVVEGTNTHLYIGHANYKHNDAYWDNDWHNAEEIPNQLKFNSMYKNIKGSSFFSLRQLRPEILDISGSSPEQKKEKKELITKIRDTIKNDYFNTKALVPSMPWLDNKAPNAVVGINTKKGNNEIQLTWKDSAKNDSSYYVIYRY
ncbi:glycoside hydrolase family 10 protein [Clostridium polynesiense]|uniref:glycoside hydrolase family 10 protein n=1 Tax=Clostridium polynesiense TaxID=1325933 RepID=UPI0006947FEC|nr:family 10 glycosylhydrolase [Clostridium polynesiense]